MIVVKISIVSFYSMFSKDVLLVPLVGIILCSLLINAESICNWEVNALDSSQSYSSIRLAVPEEVEGVEVNGVSLRIDDKQCSSDRFSVVESCELEDYNGYSSLLIKFKNRTTVKYVEVQSSDIYITAQTVPSKSITSGEYGFVLTENQQFHVCPSTEQGNTVELTWTVEGNTDSGLDSLEEYACVGSDGFYCLNITERDPRLEAQLELERANPKNVSIFQTPQSVSALIYSTKCIVEKTATGFRHTLNVTRPENKDVSYYYCHVGPSNNPFLSYTIDWTGIGNE
ncbi:hypothetical protein SprV_0702443900 [Sparganum proliferum]